MTEKGKTPSKSGLMSAELSRQLPPQTGVLAKFTGGQEEWQVSPLSSQLPLRFSLHTYHSFLPSPRMFVNQSINHGPLAHAPTVIPAMPNAPSLAVLNDAEDGPHHLPHPDSILPTLPSAR